MTGHLEDFMEGTSVNVLTYGQTASGKTYTSIGPWGCFASKLNDTIVEE